MVADAYNPDDLRAYFGFVSQQMSSLEERHLQVFLLCVTASAAIVAIPSDLLADPVPWGAIAALNLVGLFLMLRLHLWINRYWEVLQQIYASWRLPEAPNMFAPARGEVVPVHTRRAMQSVAMILAIFSGAFMLEPIRVMLAVAL